VALRVGDPSVVGVCGCLSEVLARVRVKCVRVVNPMVFGGQEGRERWQARGWTVE